MNKFNKKGTKKRVFISKDWEKGENKNVKKTKIDQNRAKRNKNE